ncbi:MAG: hypothetical protein K6T61_02720 [Bryobacteraceae bacterium]|nr:hypothetical protein [Bryobacteraceae bacterium]
MFIRCPNCGSSDLRHSYPRSPAEKLAEWTGKHMLRCMRCRHRFQAKTWRYRDLIYARCPACFCETLGTWSPNDYGVTVWSGLLMLMGAQPYTCTRCRRRFVSFRPRKPRPPLRPDRREERLESPAVRHSGGGRAAG